MLKKSHRLTQQEFKLAWDSGRRYHNQYFTVVSIPSETFKAVAVVGKKVSKLAVVRNRLRRQIYGVIEDVIPVDTYKNTILIIAKPPFAKLSERERREVVTTEIEKLLL